MRARPNMSPEQRKSRQCAACGLSVRTATIVCGGRFPEASLCLQCGTQRSLEEVYEMIEKRLAAG
jgi:hypothetical protein